MSESGLIPGNLAAADDPSPRDHRSSDRTIWIGLPLVTFAVGVMVCFLLAAAGALSVPLAVALTIPLTGMMFLALPKQIEVEGNRTPTWVWLSLIAAIGLWVAWVAAFRSELVVTGRDGATYLNIAKGLVESSELRPEVVIPPFTDTTVFRYESPGWVVGPNGTVYQQFLHGLPALWALAGRLFGDNALAMANSVVGGLALLATFGVARLRLRTTWAVGAVVALAAAFPMVYYSRSTFSEPAALLLVAGGTWLTVGAVESKVTGIPALVAGFVLGTVTMVRIDGWLVGLAVAVAILVLTTLEREASARTMRSVWLGFLAASAVSMLDLIVFSRPYLVMHRSEILALVGGSFIARVLAGDSFRRIRSSVLTVIQRLVGRWPSLPTVLAVVVIVLLFVARPLLTTSFGETYGLAAIEEREGLPTGTGRNYSELAGAWPVWYLGLPCVIAALSWCVALTRRRKWRSSDLVIALVAGVPAVVYFALPSANPDHPWVMRRYLPVILPAIVLLAWAAAARISERFAPRGRLVVAAIAGAALVIPALAVTGSFASSIDGDGSFELIAAICDEVGSVPVVILEEDEEVSTFLMEPIRRWCGVPVAAVRIAVADAALNDLEGSHVVLGSRAGAVERFGQPTGEVVGTLEFVEERLLGAPTRIRPAEVRLLTVLVSR